MLYFSANQTMACILQYQKNDENFKPFELWNPLQHRRRMYWLFDLWNQHFRRTQDTSRRVARANSSNYSFLFSYKQITAARTQLMQRRTRRRRAGFCTLHWALLHSYTSYYKRPDPVQIKVLEGLFGSPTKFT